MQNFAQSKFNQKCFATNVKGVTDTQVYPDFDLYLLKESNSIYDFFELKPEHKTAVQVKQLSPLYK